MHNSSLNLANFPISLDQSNILYTWTQTLTSNFPESGHSFVIDKSTYSMSISKICKNQKNISWLANNPLMWDLNVTPFQKQAHVFYQRHLLDLN